MSTPSAAALAPLIEPPPKWWRWLLAGLVLLTLWPVLLSLAPGMLKFPRYDVSGGQIVARSLAASTVIPAGTKAEKTTLMLGRKLYGSAMPGYVAGRFNSNRGEVIVYSDGSPEGLLFATRPPTFITPADPETLFTVQQHGDSARFWPAHKPRFDWTILFFLWPLLLLWRWLIRPPRVTYEIHGDTLTVKTRASTTDFPRHATKASLTTDALGVRLFGTGIPGYHTGTFATRSGNVQAAASSARSGQALLLEYAGKKYYLTPGDPEAVAAWFEQE